MNRSPEQWSKKNIDVRVRQQIIGSGEPIPKAAHQSDDHLLDCLGLGPIVVTFDDDSGGLLSDGIVTNPVSDQMSLCLKGISKRLSIKGKNAARSGLS